MLVGSSVEHILRLVLGEDAIHVLSIGNAGDYGLVLDLRIILRHKQPDIVHRSLRLVDQCHLRRREFRDLSHHLGADGTGSTSNQDPASLQ